MNTHRRLAAAAAIFAMTAAVSSAQSVTSAHSGTLHYFEGTVTIDGNPVEAKTAKFNEIKENSVLRTTQGRAEILLTPGVFLRVGENTSIKMLDNRLLSTRVEFLSGSAIVESDDPAMSIKDPAVTILYKTYEIQPLKYGVFEITSEPAQMKVYKGEANVVAGMSRAVVKDGRLMPFSAALLTEKFDEKQADDLYLWTRDRSAYISAANMSSARTLSNGSGGYSGLGYSGFGPGGYSGMGLGGYSGMGSGSWYLNPYLGMYTYMPYDGFGFGPFGYGFFSPYSINSFYNPSNYYWYGGGGARTGSFVGQPLSTSGLSRVVNSSLPRLTSGSALHPTLSSPVAGTAVHFGSSSRGGSMPALASRGGYSNSANSSGGFAGSSSGGGGFSGASLGGSGGGGGGHAGGVGGGHGR
jgi:hypothetical protein